MPIYIVLSKFTEKGVGAIRESPTRVEDLKPEFKKLGGELKEFYGLMGKYDTLMLIEADNDEVAARISLFVASKGNVHTMTLRAFSEGEWRELCGSVPA